MQIPDEEGIVIDGFPRDVAQALSFEDQVSISSFILKTYFLLKNLEIKIYIYFLEESLIWNEFWPENGQVHQYELAEGCFPGTRA